MHVSSYKVRSEALDHLCKGLSGAVAGNWGPGGRRALGSLSLGRAKGLEEAGENRRGLGAGSIPSSQVGLVFRGLKTR